MFRPLIISSLLLLMPAVVFAQTAAIPPQVAAINKAIEQTWTDYEIRPSPDADDAQWCRRVYLDVLGRIPSYEELTEFLGSRDRNKRRELVQTLLHDDKYTEEYARNWATIWTNVLIGRSGGTDRRSMTSRDGMQKYLRDSFAQNKSYNQMVYELVSATGSTKPGTENFNGAVNFLADKVNEEKGVLATSSVSRIFLGQQVQCTQCHNHPFNQWKQQKFWEFNAFFRQSRMLRRYVDGTRDIDHGELVNEDYAGEAGDPEDAMIFYELRNGLTKVAYPVFIDGGEIPASGFVSDVNRREELAKMMLDNEFLDKMFVNRMWGHFLGYGFTKPIDDLGPHNPSSHPELLQYLGEQVRQHSYDPKQLIEWITLSRPYQLSSQMTSNNELDDPTLGESPKFSHFYLRQMQAEDLYQSLLTASGASAKGSYEKQEQARRKWLSQFVVAFGTDEGDEATTFNGSIPQALMMFNGDLIKQATAIDKGSFLGDIRAEDERLRAKLDKLFLTGVARRPTRNEQTMATKLLAARGGDEAAMLQDMWWALLNSNEFIMQH
ncbi:hypothetical protein FF011L_17230 [Roseimaritima multifibrata]|uniref:Cytochrome c domain-containing protein n=1 Tax=Roseimaritima multifibrata TaxID=1930274 RepID=A0A517MDL3_9BACT|nr:DUF1549 domain-containing protein [Roseimaritima multifibrata]QDS92968.1 hypothetical protein FF011L_17230 [Roseimaritima multifibrata]